MLDWYLLFLTPLLVLPIVALFVFVGCTLNTGALPFWSGLSVTFKVVFDAALGGENALFDIIVEVDPDDPAEPQYLGVSEIRRREPDELYDDGRFVFRLAGQLPHSGCTVTCRVFASVDGRPVNGGLPVVQSVPCRPTVADGGEVKFDAPSGESWFTLTGCE